MLRNHLKTAFRTLARNRNFTFINVAGLAVGTAVCIIIFIIIRFQTSFDEFHSKKDRIYRVLTEYQNDGEAKTGKDVPFPLPEALLSNFPQIERVAPVWASHNDKLLIQDNNGTTSRAFKEDKGVFFAGPSFFEIFDYPLFTGSYESLQEPGNVLLTKDIAEKYFGDWKTAQGKTIKLEAGGSLFSHSTDVLKVSGILATIPANTDLQFKMVVSYGTGISGFMTKNADWNERTNSDFGCFILLPPNASADGFNELLRAYSRTMYSSENNDANIIQPLSEVHFDTHSGNYSNKAISRTLLDVLWLIAGFILLIACINFVNLSTAQAAIRSKETGIRKVLGSKKSQLQIQFVIETLLIVIIAVILACFLTILALPYVNQLLELSLSFRIFNNPSIIVFLLTLTIVVTLLAGLYPAVVLSGFNPVSTLKSNLTNSTSRGITLRRGLVVFQFIIAQALIIGTIIMARQMNYFMDQPPGFDKDAIINVPFRVDTVWFRKVDYLRQKLLSVNGVKAVSFSSSTPVEDGVDIWSTFRFDRSVKEENFKVITRFADDEYVPTYRLQLKAGRNLKPSGMSREFLVNETLMRGLGIADPEEILNKEISIWDDRIKCPVVGVLKDFNDRPFRDDLAPLIITTNNTMYSQAAIKLETTDILSVLQSVKTIWEETLPNFVFEYRFLDDKIAGFYKQENQLARLYGIFAAIAIFLSCLGLYGLALFMAVQGTKEVGIRKVHGASAISIVCHFSKEFVILIIIAFAFAAPIAWYYMQNWLQGYAYRISISWWLFAAGGFTSLIIALTTTGFWTIRAALANPADSLRSE